MVLDTNILVAYLKGEPEVVAALEQWRQEGRGLVVSSISLAEVLALPALSGSGRGYRRDSGGLRHAAGES